MPASQAGRRRFDPGLPLQIPASERSLYKDGLRNAAYWLFFHEGNSFGTNSAADPRWTSSKYRAFVGSVRPRKIACAGFGLCLSMATKLATGCTDPDVPMAMNASHSSKAL